MDNILSIQLKEVFHFFITGIEISFIFDIFRAKRKVIKTSDVVTYFEDVIYWVIARIYFFIHNIKIYKWRNKKLYDSWNNCSECLSTTFL